MKFRIKLTWKALTVQKDEGMKAYVIANVYVAL
jgi:hypothetical protein